MGKDKLIRAIFFIFLFGTTLSLAQDAAKNNQKYWFYRYRLLHEFLAKGEAACGAPSGFSIPASHIYGNSATDVVHVGDGTSFLGNYIGVLATEHKRMENREPAWKLEKVREELYYAMKAYERLDRNAEVIYWDKIPGNCNDANKLNGFFTREDYDSSFVRTHFSNLYFDHTKVDNIKLSGDVQDEHYAHVSGIDGKFKQSTVDKAISYGNCGHKRSDAAKCASQAFPSQDQISNMFVGFALVKKCMPADLTYNGYNFHTKAIEYTREIHNYLFLNNYKINYPGTTEYVKYGGIETQVNAKGLHDAAKHITGEAKDMAYSTALFTFRTIWDWYNYPTGNFYFRTNYFGESFVTNCDNDPVSCYHALKNAIMEKDDPLAPGHDYANAIIAQLAAIGNSWEVGLIPEKIGTFSVPSPLWVPCADITQWVTVCVPNPWPLNGCKNIRIPRLVPSLETCFFPSFTNVEIWCYKNNIPEYLNSYLPVAKLGLTGELISSIASISNRLAGINTGLCAPFSLADDFWKISFNVTGYALSKYGHEYNIENFALLNRFLHPTNLFYEYDAEKINRYFNTAPCNGSHHLPINDPNVNPYDSTKTPKDQVGDKGVQGWRVDNRFEKTNESLYSSQLGNQSNNGLDYMLAYNLFMLLHPSYESYNDILHLELHNKSLTEQSKNIGLETIDCQNTVINSTANQLTTLRAGINVKLSNNVSVKSGSNVRIYTDPKMGLNCSYTDGLNYTPTNARMGDEQDVTISKRAESKFDTSVVIKQMVQKYEVVKKKLDEKLEETRYVSREEYIALNSAKEEKVLLSVHPNPSIGKFNLTGKLIASNATKCSIKNALGILVSEQNFEVQSSGQVEIDLSDIADGVYFLFVTGYNETFKLVKSK